MVKCFFEENNTTKVLKGAGGGEKEFTESATIGLNVFNMNACKTLADRAGGFIGGKDTFPRSGNVCRGGDKLICSDSTNK